jgi:hypothetical protein
MDLPADEIRIKEIASRARDELEPASPPRPRTVCTFVGSGSPSVPGSIAQMQRRE